MRPEKTGIQVCAYFHPYGSSRCSTDKKMSTEGRGDPTLTILEIWKLLGALRVEAEAFQRMSPTSYQTIYTTKAYIYIRSLKHQTESVTGFEMPYSKGSSWGSRCPV